VKGKPSHPNSGCIWYCTSDISSPNGKQLQPIQHLNFFYDRSRLLEQTICTDCGGTLIEYYEAAGNGICIKCGTVVEENAIVSEVMFGETSAGAAMVQGSYVGQGSSKSPSSAFTDSFY
jgi:ribosomal protein S27E